MDKGKKKFRQHILILSILVATMLMIIPSISALDQSPAKPLPSIKGKAIVSDGRQIVEKNFNENNLRGLANTLVEWMKDIIEESGLTPEDFEELGIEFTVGIFSTVTIGDASVTIRAIGTSENPMNALLISLMSFANQYNKWLEEQGL